jgi:hypothetical protein
MAILHFTGFETGSGLEDINGSVTGTGSIQSSIKRTGTYALQINPLTTGVGHFNLRKLSTGTGSHSTNFDVATTYTRFYLYIATLPAANSEEFFTARTNADGVKLALRLNSAGNVLAYDTTGTNLLATGSTVLGLGQWYRIEVQCGTGGAATYTVKIDGTQEFTGTGDLNATNNGRVTLGKRANRNGQTVDFYYDDLSVSDSAFPGAGACKVMRVSADGNYTTWTIGAGAGSDWENIDEIPPDDDTTYLLSTLVSAQASTGAFETAASAGITGTVNSVQIVVVSKRDGGSNGSVRVRMRSGSTDFDTTSNQATGSAYDMLGISRDTDPATSAAWLLAALDSLEGGIIERSTTAATRLTAVYAQVDYVPAPSAGAGMQVIFCG